MGDCIHLEFPLFPYCSAGEMRSVPGSGLIHPHPYPWETLLAYKKVAYAFRLAATA